MSTYAKARIRSQPHQRGFTLVELMVTVGIALFLLGGLVTIMQNVRQTSITQQRLAELQDAQRFALTVITDAVQAAGYFNDPTAFTTGSFPIAGAFGNGWVFAGSHVPGALDKVALDSLATRFQTFEGHGPILCNGTDSGAVGAPAATHSIQFTVTAPAPGVPGQLWCSVDGAAALPLVNGVEAMAVYYGVKRTVTSDYNVDTYLTWDLMNGTDNLSISAVRVVLTFTNPLAGQPGQPGTITMERVIEVMSRAGIHT
jgi:type IV pilus assembly protein PilW